MNDPRDRAVTCPLCHAPPGRPCHTPADPYRKPFTGYIHRERVRAAREARNEDS